MSATIGTKLSSWLHGRFVGRDAFGNRYFETRRVAKGARCKRWVIYQGVPEASKVPAQWHGWLHYTLDAPLSETKQYNWQKNHVPNLTGTTGRYLPPGHISKAGTRAAAAADYEPWSPQ
ncbi:MAG: NADH:ubiquinone oxidoreductase subunit NDUFA12 [Pseudomonadota bacterium]